MKSPLAIFQKIFTIFSLSFISIALNAQQTLVNELWEVELNYPDTVEWSSSKLVGSDMYTTGNTWHNATQKTNIVTKKLNSTGSVVWETEYNGTLSEFDYGAAIDVDGSGNVYVAGATHNSDSYTFDVVVIKYNSSGVQQWATTYNGTGDNNDIPSAILINGSDIYVCAASTGSGSGYDYATIKLSTSGTISWTSRYDYNDLYDIPGHLAMQSTNIVVTGASQSTATNWDYTAVKYNSSGTQVASNRSSAAGYGFDRPTGLVKDASDNFYITGFTFNGTDFDMRTIKLDDDLSPIWTVSEDDGGEDGSNGICIDGSNNIYIAGFAEGTVGNERMKIVKYNSSGTLQWEKIIENKRSDINARAMGITYNSTNNRVLITGFYEYTTGIMEITTLAINANNSNVVWQKNYPNIHASIDIPIALHESANNIWVYGTRVENDTTRYITIKYETYDREEEDVLDSLDRPIYVDKQLLVSFDPELVDLEFVNNRQIQFANLEDVIDEELYTDISSILDGEGQFTIKALKVYRRLTANDSLSITRLGDTIPIPKFWSTLLLVINVNPIEVLDTLNNIEGIQYADLNSIFLLDYVPNDLNDQLAFYGGISSDDDIDADDAWDIQHGRTNVKVGIYDTGIYWNHEDYHFTSGSSDFEDSKIEGGWDWDHDHHVSVDDNGDEDSYYHGTAVAGIVAAISDNELGVAGVAGGSYNEFDINSTGVQLFDMEIGKDNIFGEVDTKIDEDYAADAILEGATFTPGGGYGYGLNIMNHSWGSKTGGGDMITVGNNIRFAFNNQVITVCSKGNDESDNTHYPSDFRDSWLLSVGGSGVNGTWEEGSAIIDNDGSNYGNGVDLVAPYGFDIDASFRALDNIGANAYWNAGNLTGTSFSAPLVAGTAALMLSEVNHSDGTPHFENLTHEDVEHLLEETADDNDEDPSEVGYDDYTGWGLLDAGEALGLVDRPLYKIVHVCNEFDVSGVDPEEEDIYLDVFAAATFYDITAGAYVADRYKVTFTSNHTLSPTAEIIDHWILPSMANTLAYAEGGIPVSDEPYFEMTTPTLTSTDVTGYFYFLKAQWPGFPFPAVNKWIPFDPTSTKAKFCYSLHIYDEEAVDEIEQVTLTDEIKLSLFPNPVITTTNILIETERIENVTYLLTNMSGQVIVKQDNIILSEGFNKLSLDCQELVSGIYTFTIFGSTFNHSFKIVKI